MAASASGVTAFQNPSHRGSHMLFHVHTNKHMTLQEGTTDSTEKGVALRGSTSLCSLFYKDLVSVYGVVAADNKIYRLSPAFKVVPGASTSTSGGLAGSTSPAGNSWLYYISQRKIRICSLDTTRDADIAPTHNPSSTSYIAAYHATAPIHAHFVIYQQEDDKVYEVNARATSGAAVHIGSIANARKDTSFSTCSIDGDSGVVVYLYYISTMNKLHRVIRGGDGKWGTATDCGLTVALASNTQISAVPEYRENSNAVYYQASVSGAFHKFSDKIPSA